MRTVLDTERIRQRYDRGRVAETLALLPQQIRHAVTTFRPTFGAAAKRAHTLLAVGMGGSALGTDLIRGICSAELRQSLVSVRTPELPAAARRGTLIVATSYSGDTAETLTAARIAKRRGLPLIVVATGGKLASLAASWRVPYYRIDPATNPSRQPRLGLGSMTTALLIILDRLGWHRFPAAEQAAVLRGVSETWQRVQPSMPQRRNPLKQMATALARRFAIIVASDRYWGNAHILANQLNENAKTFAAPFVLPELNHHLLEGLRFPAAMRSAAGIFLRGTGDAQLDRRFVLTEEVFRKNGLPTFRLEGIGPNPLVQAFSFLVQTSTLSYYLGLVHRIDPAQVSWVAYFKRALARR